jgi:DNA polymerase I-like protein with 3'-5' exonuclease and polymerase domains
MSKDRFDVSTDDFLLKMDLNNPDVEWFMPSEFPDLTRNKTMAIDLETRDPDLTRMGPGWATGNGEVIGVSIASGDFSGYFPIAHAAGPNLDKKVVLRWLQVQLNTPGTTKIMHNASYDVGWLLAEGIKMQGPIIDTMLVAPLLDENRMSYRLDLLGKDYLGLRKDEKILRNAAAEWGIDPKSEMWRLPARYVGVYAEQDAVLTLKLWERFRPMLEEQSLMTVCDLEHRVLPAVIDMRMRGVRVDLDKAAMAKAELRKAAQTVKDYIFRETQIKVDPWAAASVQRMFDSLGLSYPRTEAGAPSFTKQFLQAMDHPVAKAMVTLREMDKADSTFIDSILRYQKNGRVHCEMHQLRSDDGGTVTGRFSSSNPNLQQIPARDPYIKKLIRGLFIPEDGCQWGSFDYSSQEPRLLVHFAASHPDTTADSLVSTIVQEYQNGDADLHQMVADMAGISRKAAKTINLGIMYGMGVAKLGNQLGLTEEQAKALMAEYQDKVPFVKKLATLASSRAEREGRIRTIRGRLCRFDLWEPATFGYNKPMKYDDAQREYGGMSRIRRAFTYKALNRVIQGSAADQNKLAMAECYEEGLVPLLTVHDELCFNIETAEQAARITKIMEEGLSLKVPSKVDQELGSNWGEVG